MNHGTVTTKDSGLFHTLLGEKRMEMVSILIWAMIRSDSYRIPSKSFIIRILIPHKSILTYSRPVFIHLAVNMFCYTIWELAISDHDLFFKCCIHKLRIISYNVLNYF